MSYSNFQSAVEMIKHRKDYISVPLEDPSLIEMAEKFFHVRFSKQHREFYETFNYLNCSGEFYGIFPKDNDRYIGNAIAWTKDVREEWGHIPFMCVPIYDLDDGEMAFLDYTSLNAEGEPRIVVAQGTECGYEFFYGEPEVLAEDLGDFLLFMIHPDDEEADG